MFRRPTVLVVGAGASFEADLPIGADLLKKLASSLHLSFDFGTLQQGDHRIENALRRHCIESQGGDQHAGLQLMNEYVHAGWRIAEAALEGASIDAIIDHHEDKRVEFMGKLGIAREMLRRSRRSNAAPPHSRYSGKSAVGLAYHPGGGESTVSFASLAPQREHLSRGWIFENSFVPQALADSNPFSVRLLSQLVQSILRPAPKRTRSAADRTCFVDITER